jgi:hypothetical protein
VHQSQGAHVPNLTPIVFFKVIDAEQAKIINNFKIAKRNYSKPALRFGSIARQ